MDNAKTRWPPGGHLGSYSKKKITCACVQWYYIFVPSLKEIGPAVFEICALAYLLGFRGHGPETLLLLFCFFLMIILPPKSPCHFNTIASTDFKFGTKVKLKKSNFLFQNYANQSRDLLAILILDLQNHLICININISKFL